MSVTSLAALTKVLDAPNRPTWYLPLFQMEWVHYGCMGTLDATEVGSALQNTTTLFSSNCFG